MCKHKAYPISFGFSLLFCHKLYKSKKSNCLNSHGEEAQEKYSYRVGARAILYSVSIFFDSSFSK